jgi:PAS domain S-box-containing protein
MTDAADPPGSTGADGARSGAAPPVPTPAVPTPAVADPRRVGAVRATGLLDSEAEEAFDRLTRLAVRLVGVPAAFVSVVDAERDFYKSACGFAEPLASARALTGPTFCHYTVQRTAPLVIPDTAADPAYRDVPTVRTLGVAAYVGIPLVAAGQTVGAFCAIDTRPRAWTDGEIEILTELAASAQRELDLRAAVAAADATAAQLRAQRAELEASNQQLQEQAAELGAQAEDLQATAAHLEEQAAALEAAHRATQAAYRTAEAERARATGILEATTDAYFALDASFRITAVNAAMERGSGLAREALVGRDYLAAFPGAAGTDFERHYRRAAAERVEAHFTHDYSDGRLDLVVEVDAYPGPDGGVAVFWRDVTARARAEAVLRASEARYRGLFTAIDEGFCVLEVLFDGGGDPPGRPVDYRFVEANPAFVAQTGLADPVGRTIRELVPDIEQHWIDTYGRVATTGEPTRFETRSDAMGRWFDVFAFRTGEPDARRVALLFTDRTAARAAEDERGRLVAALDAERARLADVVRLSPAFVAVLRGPEHVISLTNAGYDALIGHRDVRGRPVADALPEAAAQGFVALLDRVLATGEPFVGREVPYHRPDATGAEDVRYVDFVYQALAEADGTRSGRVRARRRPHRLGARARRGRAAARRERAGARRRGGRPPRGGAGEPRQERVPDDDEPRAAHAAQRHRRLRELLALGVRGPVTEAQRQDLDRLRRANRHMTGLVEAVLTFARVDAGQVEYHLEAVPLGPVVADLEALVGPQVAAKGLAYDHDGCGPETPHRPHVVRADAEKVRQVLLNLLTNAVKFTDAGGRVSLACETDAIAGVIRVRVTDTGRGIAADQLERIFEPFVQVDRQRTHASQQGVGLGLAISRDLARGMGGDLTAESTPGRGAPSRSRCQRPNDGPASDARSLVRGHGSRTRRTRAVPSRTAARAGTKRRTAGARRRRCPGSPTWGPGAGGLSAGARPRAAPGASAPGARRGQPPLLDGHPGADRGERVRHRRDLGRRPRPHEVRRARSAVGRGCLRESDAFVRPREGVRPAGRTAAGAPDPPRAATTAVLADMRRVVRALRVAAGSRSRRPG